MNRTLRRHGRTVWVLVMGLAVSGAARADALTAVQTLRLGGCGGVMPAVPPLHHSAALDEAAARWAAGTPLGAAAGRSGHASGAAGVRIAGPDPALLELLRRTQCHTVVDAAMGEIGSYRAAGKTWLVLTPARRPGAAPAAPPAAQASVPRALELINAVRARGTRCGARTFAPVPPLRLSGTLAAVASGHAVDMARHGYFEHEDLAGHSPADRVRAIGYRETLVGENIAYGPASLEEAVRGWLDSPGHCENIMDPRFQEMGIGQATGTASRRGLYWVQVLAAPRA